MNLVSARGAYYSEYGTYNCHRSILENSSYHSDKSDGLICMYSNIGLLTTECLS